MRISDWSSDVCSSDLKQVTSYVYQDPTVLAGMGGKDLGQLSSRNMLNGNIAWDQIVGSPIDVSVLATNLTNEKYYQFVPGLGSSGLEFATLGEPRMYGVRLRYSRSEAHTSELQSLMRSSSAVFCLYKKQ